jgi:septal ring factor EnvC (AmiA/AmiB activator)
MGMEWAFMALSGACLVFLVQILLEYNRQLNDLRPQVKRIEQEMKGENEERDRHVQMSEELKAHIAQLELELAQLEPKRTEFEKILQSRQAEGGPKSEGS